MKKGLVALALGTFGFGIVEYGMMSILPDLASTFGLTIPQAGNLISMYALGVCAGAPVAALLFRNSPLKRTLILLMAVYAVGNILFAISRDYHLALAARFISGLPHGAFFGTGSIVASRLMPDKATTAVAIMVMGMTFANFVGIPVGTFMADHFSWRFIFYFAGVWGLLTLVSIIFMVKDVGALAHSSLKGVFSFLKRREPWMLIVATMMCNGGAFAMYSYVSPVMEATGFTMSYMPLLMLGVGAAMCLGNYLGGTLSDRRSPQRVALYNSLLMTLVLVAVYLCGSNELLEIGCTLVVAGALFAMSSPMQLLLIEYSPGGELMGGAMVQVAFNLGNAIGAYAGGLPIDAGAEPASTGLVGAALSIVAFVVMIFFCRRTKAG